MKAFIERIVADKWFRYEAALCALFLIIGIVQFIRYFPWR